MNLENDDKTIFISRKIPDDTETHICPICGTSNPLRQLMLRDYCCSSCKLELAHLDFGPNDSIRGVFGWLLPIGEVFAERYQIKAVLGKGGFGATYLVDDLRLSGKRRALKEVPELLFDMYESTLLSRLDHPSIPDIIDHVVANGMQYLVLKFGGSRTLGNERKLSQNRRIPLDKLTPWMFQLCEVLIYLHSQNPPVIHRDLKPDNILLNEDDRIMLIDFGIAKEISNEHTRTSANAVSESFSSPEQIAGTGTDMRADIYSLGATFYALLTGINPPGAFARLSGQELIPPSRIVNEISPEVESAIMQALILKKEDRQQSVREFALALGSGDYIKTRLSSKMQGVLPEVNSLPEIKSVTESPNVEESAETMEGKSGNLGMHSGKLLSKQVVTLAGYAILIISIAGIVYYFTENSEPKISSEMTSPATDYSPIKATNQTTEIKPNLPLPVEAKSETALSPPAPSPEQLLDDLIKQIKLGDGNPQAFTSELEQKMDQFIPPLKEIPLSLSQDGIYRENDSITFSLTLASKGYLHIFIFEPNGKATLIFPSQYAKNNRVGPGIVNLPNGKPPIIAGQPFGKSWFMAYILPEANNLYQEFSKDKTRVKNGLLELRIWEVLGYYQKQINNGDTKATGALLHICSKKGECP